MLEISGLTKQYGSLVAVDDVSLTIDGGELFTIVGPSGSGKSTLLRCISGLETPNEGQIRLADEDVTERPPHGRNTSMVFQNLALFPHMTVRENVAYGMKRQGRAGREIAETVERNLALIDLEGYEDRPVRELSGGEQQRVALARSLAVQPELLLLDEPLGSLDQQLRVQLQNELYELQRDLGQTMVYVTHDQTVALAISDRVAVMNRGRVEQVGTPEELYEDPQTLFVASFIGESNAFPGTVTAVEDGEAELAVDGSGHTVRGALVGDGVEPEATVQGVVKSEDVGLGSPDGGANSFEGTIIQMAYQGEKSKVRIEVDQGFVVEAMTAEARKYDIGDRVALHWRIPSCRIYTV